MYSNPPAHGARIVQTVLHDPALYQEISLVETIFCSLHKYCTSVLAHWTKIVKKNLFGLVREHTLDQKNKLFTFSYEVHLLDWLRYKISFIKDALAFSYPVFGRITKPDMQLCLVEGRPKNYGKKLIITVENLQTACWSGSETLIFGGPLYIRPLYTLRPDTGYQVIRIWLVSHR